MFQKDMLGRARPSLAHFELFRGDGRGVTCFGQFLPCCNQTSARSHRGYINVVVVAYSISFAHIHYSMLCTSRFQDIMMMPCARACFMVQRSQQFFFVHYGPAAALLCSRLARAMAITALFGF